MPDTCPRCRARVNTVRILGQSGLDSSVLAIDATEVELVELRADGRGTFGVVVTGFRPHERTCPARISAIAPPSPITPPAIPDPIVELAMPDGKVERLAPTSLAALVRTIASFPSLIPGLRSLARALEPLNDRTTT